MASAETVPSWFLLNLKVSKLGEIYYGSTKITERIYFDNKKPKGHHGRLTLNWRPLYLPSKVASINAINNVSACLVLFLSTTGLFPARRKLLEHETQSSIVTFTLMSILELHNNGGYLESRPRLL